MHNLRSQTIVRSASLAAVDKHSTFIYNFYHNLRILYQSKANVVNISPYIAHSKILNILN